MVNRLSSVESFYGHLPFEVRNLVIISNANTTDGSKRLNSVFNFFMNFRRQLPKKAAWRHIQKVEIDKNPSKLLHRYKFTMLRPRMHSISQR